jgi:hypothetical protein
VNCAREMVLLIVRRKKLVVLYVTGFCGVVLQLLRTCDVFCITIHLLVMVHYFSISVAALEVSAAHCTKLNVRVLDFYEAA